MESRGARTLLRMRRLVAGGGVLALTAFSLAACNSILGITDLSATSGDASASDSSGMNGDSGTSMSDSATSSDAAKDAAHDGLTDAVADVTYPPCGATNEVACSATGVCCGGACGAAADNCGTCGHNCLGGACTSGKCQPVTVVSGLQSTTAMTMDNSNFYIVGRGPTGMDFTDGYVAKVPITGGTVTTLATGQETPTTVTYDSTYVYWANYGIQSNNYADGSIVRVPIAGGTPSTLVTNVAAETGLIVTSTNLYWVENQNAIYSSGLDGSGAAMFVATDPGCENPVLYNNTLFWTNQGNTGNMVGTVVSYPLGGGAVTTIAAQQLRPFQSAVSTAGVFWLDYGITNGGTPNNGSVQYYGTDAKVHTLASSLTQPGSIALDQQSVYWTTYLAGSPGTLSLYSAPVTGGAVSTLVSGNLYFSDVIPQAQALYMLSTNGILMLAK